MFAWRSLKAKELLDVLIASKKRADEKATNGKMAAIKRHAQAFTQSRTTSPDKLSQIDDYPVMPFQLRLSRLESPPLRSGLKDNALLRPSPPDA